VSDTTFRESVHYAFYVHRTVHGKKKLRLVQVRNGIEHDAASDLIDTLYLARSRQTQQSQTMPQSPEVIGKVLNITLQWDDELATLDTLHDTGV
jgi:hypothetical protein